MSAPELKVTGRVLPVSEDVRRRSPELYGPGFSNMIKNAARKCPPIPERPVIMDDDSVKSVQLQVAKGMQPSTDELKLNKTERAYWQWLQRQGDLWCGCQCITLKFGHDLRFTADFFALSHEGLRAIDVKGFQRDDALVKIKACARLFPWIHFVIAKKDGPGGWLHTPIKP